MHTMCYVLPEHSVQVRVVPVGGASGENGRLGREDDEGPRKRAKVMLLQIRRKGRSLDFPSQSLVFPSP